MSETNILQPVAYKAAYTAVLSTADGGYVFSPFIPGCNGEPFEMTLMAKASSWTSLTLQVLGSMDGITYINLPTTSSLTADGFLKIVHKLPYYKITLAGVGTGTVQIGVYT